MTRNYLFLLFIAGFVLFIQSGCQEQNIPVRELSVEPKVTEVDTSVKVQAQPQSDDPTPIITFENPCSFMKISKIFHSF